MMRRTVTVHLKATHGSPYSPSKRFESAIGNDIPDAETLDAQCWREHAHVNKDGYVEIPAISFKKALTAAAKMIRQRIVGKGQSEYGKHFKGGCLPMDNLVLPIKRKDLEERVIDCSANGNPGAGGHRVARRYPMIYDWEGDVQFCLLSDDLGEDVFEEHLSYAGAIVGIGRWRPENDGLNGRFDCISFSWDKRLPSKTSTSKAVAAQREGRKGRKRRGEAVAESA